MANRRWYQFYNTPHKKAVQFDCSFVVDSANGNGLGIRSLKSAFNCVSAVYMHTSATAAALNPNPQAGVIMVQFADNYNRYLFGTAGFVSPVSGTPVNVDASDAALTVHNAYTIITVGTSTTADWVAVGVPVGITPAVGVSFIAKATGAGTGNGTVMAPKATGAGALYGIQVIGDPNATIISKAGGVLGQSNGTQMILGCFGATNSSTTTPILTAPADGTVIGMSFVMTSSTMNALGSE